MVHSEDRSNHVRDVEEVAHSFAQAFQENEFKQAVEYFDPKSIDEFVASLKEEGYEPLLSDQPDLVLRRCRQALQALFGSIESLSITESIQNDESTTVVVEFHCEHATKPIQLTVDEEPQITDLTFPDTYSQPQYVNEEAFEEYVVTIDSGDIELGGTITAPTERDKPPIALLVPGAGEIDRDYSWGPNRLLKDLAWGLATEGIATLRYDKREAVTDIPPEERTLETEYFEDGVAALETAVNVAEIDPDAVFVIGHSRGGMCAPEIARRHGNIAGVAALDPQMRSFFERDAEDWREFFEIDGHVPPFFDEMKDQYKTARQRFLNDEYEPGDQLMDRPVGYLDSLWEFDQFEAAGSLSCPLFTYQLEGMSQAPEEKLQRWEKVLSDDEDSMIKRPELSHNFQRGEKPRSFLEPVLFHKNVDEFVIEDLVSWVNNITG